MKKLSTISIILSAIIVVVSCSDVKRDPGSDYMPDMRYSRAYETYSDAMLRDHGINYTAMPVAGTIQRGEIFPFSIPKDKDGDITNYVSAKLVSNPLPVLDPLQFTETERLYLINCGICHGTNLDGNGPLYNNGNGPYPAAPKNLVADEHVLSMADGQLFYSITYGKGSMGPYGSQLSTSDRWRIIHYLRAKQGRGGVAGGTAGGDSTSTNTMTKGAAGAGSAVASDSVKAGN